MKPIYLIVLLFSFLFMSCDYVNQRPQAVSDSGVAKATVKVQTDADGQTIEQKNVMERIKRDNIPGSIKHLYIISGISGQVLIYSTVKGKVTSSGKRLTPGTVVGNAESANRYYYNYVKIAGTTFLTNEIIGDDGTFGSSIEYLYWFDAKGVYHQHYKGGNELLHITDQPMSVKSVVLNMESN